MGRPLLTTTQEGGLMDYSQPGDCQSACTRRRGPFETCTSRAGGEDTTCPNYLVHGVLPRGRIETRFAQYLYMRCNTVFHDQGAVNPPSPHDAIRAGRSDHLQSLGPSSQTSECVSCALRPSHPRCASSRPELKRIAVSVEARGRQEVREGAGQTAAGEEGFPRSIARFPMNLDRDRPPLLSSRRAGQG